jgi:hypothetical protein
MITKSKSWWCAVAVGGAESTEARRHDLGHSVRILAKAAGLNVLKYALVLRSVQSFRWDGAIFGMIPEALRAWLRSRCPSGTKAIRPSKRLTILLALVFLAAIGAEETQIEASFCEAIRTAREQKSISLAARAEATYAEYRRQKASTLGGHGLRLPLG